MQPALTTISNPKAQGEFVLICEHASNYIPAEMAKLGLDDAPLKAHIAWDIGALDLALALAEDLDAPLISANISRLVYDCNRPPSANDAIPVQSEIYAIPGNADLSVAERKRRVGEIHDRFHDSVDQFIANRATVTGAIITVHSFTPIYHGRARSVEIGLIHHDNDQLARAVMAAAQGTDRYDIRMNEPYSRADGVSYTIGRHGDARGRDALMIEVRNDLLSSRGEISAIAQFLSGLITTARAAFHQPAKAI